MTVKGIYIDVNAVVQAIWISAGIIGFWELIVHLRRWKYLNKIPDIIWVYIEFTAPIAGLWIWNWFIAMPSLSVYIVLTITLMDLQRHLHKKFAYPMLLAVLLQGLQFLLFSGWKHYEIILWVILLLTEGLAFVAVSIRRSPIWGIYTLLALAALAPWLHLQGPFGTAINLLQLLTVLLPFITYVNERLHRETVLRERNEDSLTGLLNRRGYESWLLHHQAAVSGAALMVDLDEFKYVNDTFGHELGDRLLIEVAHRLERSIEEKDAVIRWGGDEFVVLLMEHDHRDIKGAAEKIHHHLITAPVYISGNPEPYYLRATIGATFGTLNEELIAVADKALLLGKRTNKNKVVWDIDEKSPVEVEEKRLQWVGDAFKQIMERTPKGFVLTDERHRIIEVNPVYERITGYSRAELIGNKPRMLASPSHNNAIVYDSLIRALLEEGYWEGRFINKKSSGQIWVAACTITVIKVGEKVVGYWALVEEEAYRE